MSIDYGHSAKPHNPEEARVALSLMFAEQSLLLEKDRN